MLQGAPPKVLKNPRCNSGMALSCVNAVDQTSLNYHTTLDTFSTLNLLLRYQAAVYGRMKTTKRFVDTCKLR